MLWFYFQSIYRCWLLLSLPHSYPGLSHHHLLSGWPNGLPVPVFALVQSIHTIPVKQILLTCESGHVTHLLKILQQLSGLLSMKVPNMANEVLWKYPSQWSLQPLLPLSTLLSFEHQTLYSSPNTFGILLSWDIFPSFFLVRISLRQTLGWLLHLYQVFGGASDSQWGLPWPPHFTLQPPHYLHITDQPLMIYIIFLYAIIYIQYTDSSTRDATLSYPLMCPKFS
jgi:hypothetical protein